MATGVDIAGLFHSFEYTKQLITIHAMNLLPPFAPTISFNIADLFTKPLSRHRFDSLIGDIPTTPTTSVITATVVATPATVAPLATVNPLTATSNSVPTLHPKSVLAPTPFIDTGASFPITPFVSDYIPVTQACFGLLRAAPTSDPSVAKVPNNPYTLITGEDPADLFDLSSPYSCADSDLVEFASTFDSQVLEFREFGTATLIFISGPNSDLKTILVEPTLDRFDWLYWVPLPRLTPAESYFHLLGFDYIEVFAFLHLYPLWTALLYLSVFALFALIRSE